MVCVIHAVSKNYVSVVFDSVHVWIQDLEHVQAMIVDKLNKDHRHSMISQFQIFASFDGTCLSPDMYFLFHAEISIP